MPILNTAYSILYTVLMAYSEPLAERIRSVLKGMKEVSERKMFGGLAFMFNGNMNVGVLDDMLVLRLNEELVTAALKQPHTKPMDFTGKPMKTMVYVLPEGIRTDSDLAHWIQTGLEFAKTLPPK